MAKKITRTLIVGYNYDVVRKTGNTMEIMGSVTVPNVIRSIKEQKKVLVENKFQSTDVLILTTSEQKQYEMSEEDFIKNATVVTDVTEDTTDIKEETEI